MLLDIIKPCKNVNNNGKIYQKNKKSNIKTKLMKLLKRIIKDLFNIVKLIQFQE